MAAMIIGAIDQQTANARGPHFGEGDFLAGMPNDCADLGKKEAATCWGLRWTRTNQRNSWARIPKTGARSANRNDMRAMRNARSALATPGGIGNERSDIFYPPPPLELPPVVADIRLSFNFTYLYTQR